MSGTQAVGGGAVEAHASAPRVVAEEEGVIGRVIPALHGLQDRDTAREQELRKRVQEAHQAWTDARGDRAQREAFEEELGEARQRLESAVSANRARELPLGTPYFARLVLKEERRTQEVMLGKVGVLEGGLRIVDWRNAPISKLFYEYEEGEEYSEEFAGQEREGVIQARRRVDIHDGQLQEIQAGKEVLRRYQDGRWGPPREEQKSERKDHRLPDIVSLITRDQFSVITRPDAGLVLLRGCAGSGKTTVALHRIAYLHFQDPQRFRPDKVLVVMFNKALQTYISRVLPDLGIRGVRVETFHHFAMRHLKNAGVTQEFRGQPSPAVARLKRHPAMEALLSAVVEALEARLVAWVEERVPEALRPALEATPGSGLARLAKFRRSGAWPGMAPHWRKVVERWGDHPRDLYALLEDDALNKAHLTPDAQRGVRFAVEHQKRNQAANLLDFEDAALLLRLGQKKHAILPEPGCAWASSLAHLVIDEAQDLSTLEISALVDAADEGRSVTIAGDPAQKILADAQFEGFEELLRRFTGELTVRLDALAVGHRSTRPIMQLALKALDRHDPALLSGSRDGPPVEWVEGAPEECFGEALQRLMEFRGKRPQSLVAVLCRKKADADAWARDLSAQGLTDVRRVAREDFSFQPGVIVSNVHQVKGLEFDGVILVEPADFSASDRELLHVAITRAAERLWVVASRGRGRLV